MTDNEITREKTFSEELPYFKERIKEIFDNYDNPDGYADMLYLSTLSDSNRIVRKAEEEIIRQQREIESLKKVVIDNYVTEYDDKIKTEAYKEFAERLKEHAYLDSDITGYQEMVVDLSDIENIADEMVGEE